ncbi:hypothetical protein CGMCC3_g17149 [Colletotrichum fructicola]|uniref:Uncharacterized protein n=1 Tax=Colletotrichum fructicola (strain Nara gc5) TaxID=1213859 RepID=L2FI79_COLFN|nr:uncharacterized protein CGMCC3_g17149 [Colletotrichum fructicola]KAE9566688.1 hypothetical protein CGMCC3_g17149 [Colletotrichum fructicola]KAF4430752.1 hypothetical protein CFRS1_v009679 [Colletotrichum fructicola]
MAHFGRHKKKTKRSAANLRDSGFDESVPAPKPTTSDPEPAASNGADGASIAPAAALAVSDGPRPSSPPAPTATAPSAPPASPTAIAPGPSSSSSANKTLAAFDAALVPPREFHRGPETIPELNKYSDKVAAITGYHVSAYNKRVMLEFHLVTSCSYPSTTQAGRPIRRGNVQTAYLAMAVIGHRNDSSRGLEIQVVWQGQPLGVATWELYHWRRGGIPEAMTDAYWRAAGIVPPANMADFPKCEPQGVNLADVYIPEKTFLDLGSTWTSGNFAFEALEEERQVEGSSFRIYIGGTCWYRG